MSISKKLAGSNRIYDSIENDEEDINPYSITGQRTSCPIDASSTNSIRNSQSSSVTVASSCEPPIYATVNKATKQGQSTEATLPKSTPKTLPKPTISTIGNTISSSSPSLCGNSLLRDRHLYDVPCEVVKSDLPSDERRNNYNDDDIIENPYDDIPGQHAYSQLTINADHQSSCAVDLGYNETDCDRQWPKLPPLRNIEYVNNSGQLPILKKVNVTYVGSIKMSQEQVKGQDNVSVLRSCIAHFSQPAAASQLIAIQEWPKDMSMVLVVDSECLRLLQSDNSVTVVQDGLVKIRAWGTGKESDSSIFAYITRDDVNRFFVCRVLKCKEGTGKQIINAVHEACQCKLKDWQNSDINLQRSSSVEAKVTIHCHYVGKISFTENTGKEELKKLIDIRCSSARESRSKVSMEISSSQISVRDHRNPALTLFICSVKDIVGIGSYRDDNKFGCITKRSTQSAEYIGHVFYCEPSTDHWLLNIQTVCKSQLHEIKSGIMKKMHKYFAGGRKN